VLPGLGLVISTASNIWLGIILLYLAAVAQTSIVLSWKNNRLHAFPILVLVFAAMHTFWGFGFWRGLLFPPRLDDDFKV
jgi:hypothetical protein